MSELSNFGTSRFLQAHVDIFVHQARQSGQPIRPMRSSRQWQGKRVPVGLLP